MKEYLKKFGYDLKAVEKILNNKSFRGDHSNMMRHIRENWILFAKIGLTKNEIIKITKKEPSLLAYENSTIENKIAGILNLGFTDKELLKMIKLFPTILILDTNKVIDRIDFWIELGLTKKDVLKMVKTFPALVGYPRKHITDRNDDLVKLGYNIENIKKMAQKYPQLYSLSILNIKNSIDELVSYGLSLNETMRITTHYPKIFGYKKETVRDKILCCKSLEVIDYIIENPCYLIGGTDLLYSRSQHLESLNVNYKETPRLLFLNDTRFKNRFNITKKELLAKYKIKKGHSWNI